QSVYANYGWSGVGDWLGTGNIATYSRKYRSFEQARTFARGLGLKSISEWRDYKKTDKMPDDIPANPDHVYADSGWAGMLDWLGIGTCRGRNFRAFKEARAFVRALGLKSKAEWFQYCSSGKKPTDIPSNPQQTYAEDWLGIRDWLGYAPQSETQPQPQPAHDP